jgi:hypothetical protein
MTSRAEITTRYAKAYVRAAKKDKGKVLDQVGGVFRGAVVGGAHGGGH